MQIPFNGANFINSRLIQPVFSVWQKKKLKDSKLCGLNRSRFNHFFHFRSIVWQQKQ